MTSSVLPLNYWFVAHTKPHKERQVVDAILAKEHRVFLPLYAAKPVNPRAARFRPYFPGYVFIQPRTTEELAPMRWIQGINKFIQFDGVFATVPDSFIQELREHLVNLQQLPPALRGKPAFEKGQAVRILSGPFAEYRGVFDSYLSGEERVRVLLEMLYQFSKNMPVALTLELDASQLVLDQ
ncbi:MAG TPA: transcription termination/antitermination NusG family protein [Anaerolineales bacterium]|nr:transcription termination/antitermination NusG family protein [Anaerolineales bacterium]